MPWSQYLGAPRWQFAQVPSKAGAITTGLPGATLVQSARCCKQAVGHRLGIGPTRRRIFSSYSRMLRSSAARRSASNVARNGPPLRRLIGQVDLLFVDITPPPTFRRIITFHDGMVRGVKMFGGVTMRGLVAAADVAAATADPQMNPRAADLQTFFAALRTRMHSLDGVAVRTGRHAASIAAHSASMV